MPEAEAKRILQDVANNTDRLIMLHFGEREEMRHLISLRQVIHCLESGEITAGPVRNKEGDWEMTLYRFCSGTDVYVTVAIENPKTTDQPSVYIRKVMNTIEP